MATYLKVPNIELLRQLNALITFWEGAGVPLVGLFKAAHVPASGDTLATYTAIEADFDGYARQSQNAWTAAVIAANVAVTTGENLLFVDTGNVTPNDIYGYFFFDQTSGDLYLAQEFDAPITLNGPGQNLPLTPTFSIKSEH